MHEVLVNRLGGLSLPRKSVVRLTDRPDMTLDVYRGRKTTMQQHCKSSIHPMTHYTQLFPLLFSPKNIAPYKICSKIFSQNISDSQVLLPLFSSQKCFYLKKCLLPKVCSPKSFLPIFLANKDSPPKHSLHFFQNLLIRNKFLQSNFANLCFSDFNPYNFPPKLCSLNCSSQ